MRKFRIALLLYVAFDLFILGNTAGVCFLSRHWLAAQNVPNSPPIRPMPDCILTPNSRSRRRHISGVRQSRHGLYHLARWCTATPDTPR
jgi:hypothetical protein